MVDQLTVNQLLATAEIRNVLQRFARGIDLIDEEMIASCYHPDGYDDHNAFRGSARDFAAWSYNNAAPSLAATTHFVGEPLIEFVNDTVALSETYCIAHHITHPDESGQQSDMVLKLRYLDRFERRADRWLIAVRRCAFDWSYSVPFDPAGGLQFEPDWMVGRRDRNDPSYQHFDVAAGLTG